MTTTRHTPGPWAISVHAQWAIDASDGKPVASSGFLSDGIRSVEEQAANARLIAAAPSLLAACGMALDVLISDGYDEQSPPVARLRAIIATATGA
jgi:hypothetical protein